MGMYHYVFSPERKACYYVQKTHPVRLDFVDSLLDPYYRQHNRRHEIRFGLVVQSGLKAGGFIDWEKDWPPIPPHCPEDESELPFIGHTYLDKATLVAYRDICGWASICFIDPLCDFLDHNPGRWYLYGDDLSEPLPKMKGWKRGDLPSYEDVGQFPNYPLEEELPPGDQIT